jgi:hypothetical protein
MFQVVAISLNPALLSFLKKYCTKHDPRWQFRSFPTIGSYVAAPRNEDSIDLLFFDAHDIVAGLEEKRLVLTIWIIFMLLWVNRWSSNT